MPEYKFKNPKGELIGEIKSEDQKLYIYGDIVGDQWSKWMKDETCPQDVVDIFAGFDKDKPVDVYINSGGGDVFGALAICSIIKRHVGETVAHIDGIAASAASVIACGCDKIIMPEYAQMMIHKPWTLAYGNSDDLLKACDMLDTAEDSIVEIYKSKLVESKTEKQLRNALAAETWLTGKTAGDYFKVEVEEVEPAAAAVSDFYARYKNRPEPQPKKPAEDKAEGTDNTALMSVFESFIANRMKRRV